ncbi:MAG: putative signal transduction protein with domain [Oscillospiraceae bacterium]|nr:putative signal transduction protein with domain [Oscillospiraceae bacterium]
MQVKDVMSQNVITVTQDDTVSNAAKLMNQHNIGAVPVVVNNNICGIVTDRDIVLRCVASGKSPDNCKVSDIMTSSTACVTPTHSVSDAIKLMSTEQVRRLPVLENGKLSGFVSLADIARTRNNPEIAQALSEISMP